MPSRKRKRGIERPKTHPKNRYADKPPDFSELASLYPSFAHYVFYSRDGRPRIDWTDFNATRELTRVLLLHDHGLNWWIPDGQLCPTVPNRSNYIHWIEDLLASDIIVKNSAEGERVRGLDIGTGTNCIYPLLGASLLGWNFVGTDVTNVAQEWAEKNVASNPHISDLIEIRKIDNVRVADASTLVGLRSGIAEQHGMSNFDSIDSSERTKVESPEVSSSQDKLDSGDPVKVDDNVKLSGVHDNGVEQHASTSVEVISTVEKIYQGPLILLGVVKEGEKFDFCMCNPPFFESMEESGLNPKTSCGGTAEEMVCPGGERAFITRIIEDSVALKQAIRWYTSMVGKKSNLKFLLSKLREVGVTVVKTTEFVQGKTCRWGLAWSFMTSARNIMSSHIAEKHNLSFMLEGLQRQVGAFNVLQSVDFFFRSFGASCISNTSTFTVDVSASDDNSNAILNDEVENPHKSISLPVFEPSSSLNGLPCSTNCLSFRISLFQQIPGTLLVKGSLQQRDGPISGSFSSIFQKLEEFLKQNFCKKASTDNLNQIRAR